MHSSVKSIFRAFNEPIELVVSYMYLDVKGLVTIGVGNLIDPISAALILPFRHKVRAGASTSGKPASTAEIEAEWKLIKSKTDLARKGYRACGPLTDLELDNASIDILIAKRLQQNETFLKHQRAFRDFDQWPADAQLGLLSMAWAMGPGFSTSWPRFSYACETKNFDVAADNCNISVVGNPGVIPRNHANARLFKNAAAVLAGESDGFYRRENLYYPQVVLKPITIAGR